jgi:uncharacterized membrane protein YfcA
LGHGSVLPRKNGEASLTEGGLSQSHERLKPMDRRIAVVLYVVAMAGVIVGVDLVFFRNRFWERLIVNIGIVLVFAAFYLRFLMRP